MGYLLLILKSGVPRTSRCSQRVRTLPCVLRSTEKVCCWIILFDAFQACQLVPIARGCGRVRCFSEEGLWRSPADVVRRSSREFRPVKTATSSPATRYNSPTRPSWQRSVARTLVREPRHPARLRQELAPARTRWPLSPDRRGAELATEMMSRTWVRPQFTLCTDYRPPIAAPQLHRRRGSVSV